MSPSHELVIAKVVARLHDQDPRVRRNAVGVLRLNGRPAVVAIPELQKLLRDEDPLVRNEARRTLDELRAVA